MAARVPEKDMNKSASDYVVIASATAKPGKEAELEQALREVAGPTRAQPGCIEFRLLRSKERRSTIVGFERWASKADHDRHMQGAHFQALAQRMAGVVAGSPSIVSYDVFDE
jgi:quinol monooxygenase YgiN